MLAPLAVFGQSSLPNHAFDPGRPDDPYHLKADQADLDLFPAGDYGYCRWGNAMSGNASGNRRPFTSWTEGPYATATYAYPVTSPELFLLKGFGDLTRVEFPSTVTWSPAGETFRDGFVTFPTNPGSILMRKLHFKNVLFEVNAAGQDIPLTPTARKLVVLIHGWNPDSSLSGYYGDEFYALTNSLRTELANTDWHLVQYHWEADADTGIAFLNAGVNGSEAAEIGHQHGQHFGQLLSRYTGNGIEKIHLIAHSAGAWAARAAAKYILKNCPSAKVQITLLDPFIPGELNVSDFFHSSSLTRVQMNGIKDFEGAASNLFLLENYYARDNLPSDDGGVAFSLGTQSTFQWRPTDVGDGRVDWGTTAFGATPFYDSHAGPIQFYADTVASSNGQLSSPELENPAFDLNVYGWRRSMFFNELLALTIRNHADPTINGVMGQSLTLQADAIARRQQLGRDGLPPSPKYRWLKVNKLSGARIEVSASSFFNDFTLTDLNPGNEGDYEVEAANGTGKIVTAFSIKLTAPNPMFDLVMSGTSAGNALEVQVATDSNTSPVLLTDPVTRTYAQGTLVTLTAPAIAPNGATFTRWLIDGVSSQNSRVLTLTMDRVHSAVATYQSAGAKPAVAILQPAPNLVLTEASLVSIQASASASSPATITQVQFYIDDILVKPDTVAPYSYDGIFLAQNNGTHKLAVVATDSLGRTSDPVERNLIVAINVSGPPSLAANLVLPAGTSGISYLASITASGGVAPYTWSLASGATLPPGLALVGATLVGTPSGSGNYPVKLRVTGANAQFTEGTFTVTIAPPASVGSPQFTPAPGPYTSPISVTIATTTPDATIRYTTDGSDPTASSIAFPGSFPISQSITVKARAFKAGYQDSAVTTGAYVINYGQATAAPVFSPAANAYTDPVSVFLSSATPLAQIYYTLDGTTPVPEVSTRYNGQFTLYTNVTVKAIAVAPGANSSPVTSAAYSIATTANNDNFANRRAIQGASGFSTGSNLTATKETSEPIIFLQDRGEAYNPGGKSIWWSWRAPYSSKVTFDTIGSDFNSILGVYVGSSVDQLTFVAGDDASGDTYSTSKLTFDAVQGREYQIVIDGLADRVNGVWVASTVAGSGHIRLNWQMLDPAPEPDLTTDYRWIAHGGGASEDVGQGVCIDAIGNVYTTGYFIGTASFGGTTLTSAGSQDVFIAKYAPDGRLLWVRSAGSAGADQGVGIAAGLDGKVYVLGLNNSGIQFPGVSGPLEIANPGLFVACFSSDGIAQWARGYGDSHTWSHRIATDGTGQLVVAGVFEGTADFGGVTLTSSGKTELFLTKLSPADGSAVWAKRAGGINFDETYGLAIDSQNRIYIVGQTRSFTTFFDSITISRTTGEENAFVACYDSNGNVQWARTYSTKGNNYAKAVTVDSSGNVYTAGVYNGTATFGSSTVASHTADFFIIKTDASGNLLWTREFGSPSGNDGGGFGRDAKDIGLGVDERGNIVVSGFYSGTVTVGANQITALGGVDILTAKITPAGDFIWLKTAGTPNPNAAWPSDIAVSSTGIVYQTGRFMATTTFSSLSAVSNGDKDFFLARMSGPINLQPQLPANTLPAAGAHVALAGLTLQATPFADSDAGDNQQASQWLIRTQSDNFLVFDSGSDTSHKVSLPVTTSLENGVTYVWQVRYQDSHGAWSDYSNPTAFTPDGGKLPQTIQFSAVTDHTFGDGDFDVTATASSSLPTVLQVKSGAARVASNRVTLLGSGLVTLRATQEGNDTYQPASPAELTFLVNERTLVVHLSMLAQTYTGSPRTVTAQVDGAPDAAVVVLYDGSLTPPTNAGSYAVSAIVTDSNSQGTTSDTLLVAKAQLTVKADDKAKAQGAANPLLTFTYTGFLNGDTAAVIDSPPAIATTATTTSTTGSYPITLSGGSDENYALVFQNGTLLVTNPPPTNDAFAQATILTGASGQIQASIVGATREAADPTLSGLTLGTSVWYRWTAPASGGVTFRLSGYAFAAYIGAYTGDSLATLATLANNTVSGFVTFNAVAGNTYTLMLDKWSGTAGSCVLTWLYGVPPNFATQPSSQTAPAGQNIVLSVVATGTPPPTYQWFKDGTAIPGATSATLPFNNIQSSAAGAYTVTLTNEAGTATSFIARLGVLTPGTTATQATAAASYTAGGSLIVSNTFSYTGPTDQITWQVLTPGGWSYLSDTGPTANARPSVGDTGVLVWRWTSLPPTPLNFTYTLKIAAGSSGSKQIVALAQLWQSGGVAQLVAAPDPLVIANTVEPHSADTDHDGKLSLGELLRVIELYNTRNGAVRTGSYLVDDANVEDGFGVDPARSATAVMTLAKYHSADTNHDGSLSLSELLRVIELYNHRSGTVRTGQYHLTSGTEDGFAPGP